MGIEEIITDYDMKNKGVQQVLRLGVGQMEPVIGDMKGNMKRLNAVLKEASAEEIEVLVLPELLDSGYVFQSKEEALSLSEEIPKGPFSKTLIKWSEGGRMVVGGICEKTPEGVYNSAAVFADGTHLTTYRKIHLFDDEKKWFLPGQEAPEVVSFRGFTFGSIICFDWAFPELTRILALDGAQVVLHPANLLFPYCPKAMITRSIENRIFTATASRVGIERGVKFLGVSQVTDPRGHILLRMDDVETGVSWVDINPSAADDKTLTKNTDVIKDRRPDLYGRISEAD